MLLFYEELIMNNRQIAKMTLRIDFMISTVQTASNEFEKEKLNI
jgi:hypothetical protein